jgi:hypothetical protein
MSAVRLDDAQHALHVIGSFRSETLSSSQNTSTTGTEAGFFSSPQRYTSFAPFNYELLALAEVVEGVSSLPAPSFGRS